MKKLFLSVAISLVAFCSTSAEDRKPEKASLPDHVSYLCKAQWSKGVAPFTDLCPLIDGTHCDAGCIATSMAQLMYYYKYPTSGTGIVSTRSQGAVMQSINLDETTFDYSSMIKRYDSSYTDAEGEAVATLMAACGYSVNMQYGLTFSGAYIEDQYKALINNFKYSSSAKIYVRTAWSDEAWKDRIREELAAGRPVLISAYSTSLGGHSFMCDGYYSDGTFHINWGWGPNNGGVAYNGRYDLMTLMGYTDKQQFILGIKPMEEDEDRSYQHNIIIDGEVYTQSLNGNDVTFTLPSLINSSLIPADGTIYYSVYNSNDEKVDCISLTNYSERPLQYGFAHSSSVKTIKMTVPSDLNDGEYNLILEFKPNDSDKFIGVETGDTKAVMHLSIVNGQIASNNVVASGINTVTNTHTNYNNDKIYNLQGQQVIKPSQGLFIKNGKKILIR